mgnify:CR=1 FL=1
MKKPVIATPEVTNYILRRFNLHADKKLGQNFLIDEDIVRRIAAAAELAPGEPVLEVGPGIGTLTQALAETGADVTAVELDKRLLPVLEKTLEGYENVRVINADVLELDVNSAMGGKTFKVAANLPYYITTPIIFALLEKKLPLERMVIMVQKEVAERITAAEEKITARFRLPCSITQSRKLPLSCRRQALFRAQAWTVPLWYAKTVLCRRWKFVMKNCFSGW